MKPEAAFKHWLISGLDHQWHAQTIETTTGRGVPDLNLCRSGKEIWLELKAGTNWPMLQPEQYAWLTKRSIAGGWVFVLHRTDRFLRWNLHSPKNWETKVVAGRVKITSPSIVSGDTVASLEEFLLVNQHEHTT